MLKSSLKKKLTSSTEMMISKKQGKLFLETMLVLFFQLVVLVAVVVALQDPKKFHIIINGWVVLAVIIAEFAFLFAILWNTQSVAWCMVYFTFFSILNGVLMAPIYWQKQNRKGVMMAIGSTAVIFLIMMGYGIYSYQNGFTMLGWGRYLSIALISLFMGLLLQLGLVLVGIDSLSFNKILSVIGIVLFSLYIAYDTERIFLGQHRSIATVGGGKKMLELDNPVVFALSLYLDILNLFQFIQSSSR